MNLDLGLHCLSGTLVPKNNLRKYRPFFSVSAQDSQTSGQIIVPPRTLSQRMPPQITQRMFPQIPRRIVPPNGQRRFPPQIGREGDERQICAQYGEEPTYESNGEIQRCVWTIPPCRGREVICRTNGISYICCKYLSLSLSHTHTHTHTHAHTHTHTHYRSLSYLPPPTHTHRFSKPPLPHTHCRRLSYLPPSVICSPQLFPPPLQIVEDSVICPPPPHPHTHIVENSVICPSQLFPPPQIVEDSVICPPQLFAPPPPAKLLKTQLFGPRPLHTHTLSKTQHTLPKTQLFAPTPTHTLSKTQLSPRHTHTHTHTLSQTQSFPPPLHTHTHTHIDEDSVICQMESSRRGNHYIYIKLFHVLYQISRYYLLDLPLSVSHSLSVCLSQTLSLSLSLSVSQHSLLNR